MGSHSSRESPIQVRESTPRQARALILGGTLDPGNPLALLRGAALIWFEVFREVDAAYLRKYVTFTDDAFISFSDLDLKFPASRGLHINMMPFKLFDPVGTLPASCAQYVDLIRRCPIRYTGWDDLDRIAYLTIHESPVAAGETQRRPGLHVERPCAAGGGTVHWFDRTKPRYGPENSLCRELSWGLGHIRSDGFPQDGIYMASTVGGSSMVWPALIEGPELITDPHGGIECLRPYMGPGRALAAGELCWFTDRTPHEAIKKEEGTHRQFFRLVVGPISVWYSKHNTANPLQAPGAPISDEDKFA